MSLDRPVSPEPYDLMTSLPSLTLTSDDIDAGQPLKDDLIYEGGNTSPQLSWEPGPEGTKSYVVSCYDPDAPSPSGWWHWMVVDIPADVTSLEAGAGASDGSLPGNAFHLRNDFGANKYDGSAPPAGDMPHRYYFAVHAVGEETLGVEAGTPTTQVACMMAFKGLARGVVMGTYQA
ncbi:MAG TPA: YbhB/YbcL family Raf kinase inhibitor-like protein [Nocardioides sp.]|nr:YbhB/YbcL family Raf kinase inhibitor-like protein [Nocardioides sp.]